MADQSRTVYRKRDRLFTLVEKIKLWPSRQGVLHGLKSFERRQPSYAHVVTHCNEQAIIRDSKNSRAARWLRNKWYVQACPKCGIPEWKVQKFSATVFKSGRASAGVKSRAAEAGRPEETPASLTSQKGRGTGK